MINQQLLDFIKSQLQLGLNKETITKELLANDWTVEDVEEGFNQIDLNDPVPSSLPSDFNIPAYDNLPKSKNKKLMPILLVIVLILAIGILGYFYRNQLSSLPVLKNFFSNTNVSEVSQLENEIENQSMAVASVEEVIDCGNDLNCFIAAANNCQKSKVDFLYTNEETPILNVGTMSGITRYEITGREENNCVVRIKYTKYDFKYNAETISTLSKQGKNKTEIENMEKEASTEGAGQICRLDLTKKMGEVFNEDIINRDFNDSNSEVSFDTKGNATTTFNSGLVCEFFLKLHDNQNCTLRTNEPKIGQAKEIVASSIEVSGFQGEESQVSWNIKDKNIAVVTPSVGEKVSLKLISDGSTEIIVTDNFVGDDCLVSIPVYSIKN